MNKRQIIVCVFLLYGGLLYWLTTLLIDNELKNSLAPNNGDINNISLATVYVVVGLTIYFVTMNITAIGGLVISWKRNDKVATSTFRLLTFLTLTATTLFYLVKW